ncbi:MATE family efflux transporter [Geobacter sp. DSM 9736]|uniref:MATE family efflux transporter n=1 Tax=Geobacter sp. DSM 9736 TaxID=1277350 RepID=UPI000B50B3F0|nr:MATE family efflux transporter [Geobacter sp. DSM 9736]SNB45594.1 putative efflux protein, MATE family [Geobacter sp. DSM 9736]
MNRSHDLLNDPIPQLLKTLAIPTSIGLFFNTMFNVVDTFFAGFVSTQALAALSLSFPIFFLIIAVGAGISSGATALIGHAVGAGDDTDARKMAVQALSFGLLHGILLTLVGRLVSPALLSLLGAADSYMEMALSYMDIIFAGSLFFIVNYVLNAILNATGDTRSFRNFLVAGFFLNLVLDPWFLFGGMGLPPLGLSGIAWATVIVQLCGNIYLFSRARRTGLLDDLAWRAIFPERRPYMSLARLGFPASLNMLTVAIGFFVITWFISRFGKDAVAAYGIGTRIEQVVLLPVMGMNIATLALVAQNSGARRMDRVREAVFTALKVGVGLMLVGTAAVYVAAEPLVGLFTRDEAVVRRGIELLRVESLVFPAYVILYTSVYALQGLKRPAFAVGIGFYRQFFGLLPFFYLFANHFGWGLKGVWWGIFVVTWSAAGIAVWYIRRVLREIGSEDV